MKKKIIIGIIALAVIAVLTVFFYHSKTEPTQDSFKCPESYATDDEYTKALNSFIQQELSNNPNITAQEIMEKRYNLLVANHCTNTVQNIKDKLPPDTGTTTSDMIQNELRDYNGGLITSSTTPDLYSMSPSDRDAFLFMGNQNKDYQFVVDATNDGIHNHKDLVWDDIDFWNHRGFALYSLGNCADAGAAFYHVLMRSPNDDVASGGMAIILNDKSCDTATSSSDIK